MSVTQRAEIRANIARGRRNKKLLVGAFVATVLTCGAKHGADKVTVDQEVDLNTHSNTTMESFVPRNSLLS